jgi:hypothetical protein
MRVEYTIPGWDTAVRTYGGSSQVGPSFRQQLKKLNEGIQVRTSHLLRLDLQPLTIYSMPKPVRPPELEIRDASSERQGWHQMVQRMWETFPKQAPEKGTKEAAIRNMLMLVSDMVGREDEVLARIQSDNSVI